MKIIVITDLNGTIGYGSISEENITAFDGLEKEGITIIPNTSASFEDAYKDYLSKLKVKPDIIIAEDGKVIGLKENSSIINKIKCEPKFNTDGYNLFTIGLDKHKLSKIIYKISRELNSEIGISEIDSRLASIRIYFDPRVNSNMKFEKEISKFNLNFLNINDESAIISDGSLNKKAGFQFLIKNKIINFDLSIGVGDSYSDIGFMSLCDYQIIVGNKAIDYKFKPISRFNNPYEWENINGIIKKIIHN